jgi:UDP-N-acetylglucosamine--N-acetylmuramyl-(pentapeptide) pyrophosphoryl-undecaprenol N-acetylglucosamine transferase
MRWIIAAGGTGGHVFPALSVAEALREMDPGARILFIGTRSGLESRAVPAKGFGLRLVHARGLMGLGWLAKIRTLAGLPLTAIQCLRTLAGFRPDLVLGMGGYVSGPMVLLAALLGIETAIAEQNAVAGRTNRILGRFVKRVFVNLPQGASGFSPAKVSVTGNPLRPELVQAAMATTPVSWEGRQGEEFHLFIFGGSQGALGIDRAVLEALPLLKALPYPLRVLHQTAEGRLQQLKAAYAASGIPHEVVPFVQEMDRAYIWAHLVVCRAGAASLSEIALFGRPSVLIPFPHAADDHQTENARAFASAGASVLLEQETLTGERLAEVIGALAADAKRLKGMGESARALARPEAGRSIAQECIRIVGKRRGSG